MGRYTLQGKKNSKRQIREWQEGFHRWVWLWTRGSRSYQQPWALTESVTTERQSWSRFCPPQPSIALWLATVSLQQMFSLIISKLWLRFIIMLCYSHGLYLCSATASWVGAGPVLHVLTNLYVSLTRHFPRVSHGYQASGNTASWACPVNCGYRAGAQLFIKWLNGAKQLTSSSEEHINALVVTTLSPWNAFFTCACQNSSILQIPALLFLRKWTL